MTDCRPDTGWMWTNGPEEPEVASQVQDALSQMNIEAEVKAKSYGETDSCGSFHLFGIDFHLTVNDEYRMNETTQQAFVDQIYPVLSQFGKPNLGNVKITFMPSGMVLTNPSKKANLGLLTSPVTANWQEITTAVSPPGRYTHGSAYDSDRQLMVLFGGDSTGTSRLNDTWEFDGTNWVEINTPQSPVGRANIDQTLVYDSSRGKVVLFGGLGESGHLNDTWEYDSVTWNEVQTTVSPPHRDSHAMVFDIHDGVTILFGGYGSGGIRLNDTWQYDGSWQELSPFQSPIGRFHHAMAYDENRQVTVLFGGLDSNDSRLADTWEFDGTNWTQISPVQSPPARDNHSMTFDSARGVVVLHGGDGNSGLLNDTWEYDGVTWQQVNSNQSPTARKEMSLVFDHQQNQVIFFGGGFWDGGGLTVFNETWAYQENISPPDDVFARKVYVIVYDPILENGQHLSDFRNWNEHTAVTQETINFFRQVTNQRLQYKVVETTIVTDGWPEKIDGFQYTEEEYLAVIDGQAPPHSPDTVDYNLIVNSPEFDICGKLNDGEIDEVWIYNGPYFGFYESTLIGPDAFWYNSPPVQGPHDCNRLLPIMGPSPEREFTAHNFGHRTEATMTEVYGSWQQNSTTHSWEKFALVDAQSPDYNYSGCGSTHYPPNGMSDYDYANTIIAMTNCADFDNYPNLGDPSDTVLPYSCTDVGCTELGYQNYWFLHFPSNEGCGADEVANDWWEYFVDPALALNPSSACEQPSTATPTISPTPAPTRTLTPIPDSWQPLPSGTNNWLWPIQFHDANSGWVGGEDGLLLKTTDGGVTWQTLSTSGPTIQDFHFVDAQYGWRVGSGYVGRSTDGGQTWQQQDYGANHNLFGVHFIDRQRGWLVGGDGGWIYRTVDGGQNWSAMQMPAPSVYLQNIQFVNAKQGWAIGWDGTILHSTDGGASWQRQESGTDQILEGLFFWNVEEGWIVGHGGVILHTLDGGISWQQYNSGTSETLFDVAFSSQSQGWAVGEHGIILKTSNGGLAWQQETTGFKTTLQKISLLDDEHVWVAGQGGVILKRVANSVSGSKSLFLPLITK